MKTLYQTFQTPAVGKTLKPYQGLKLSIADRRNTNGANIVAKTLKPYQGLKPAKVVVIGSHGLQQLAKTLKPYQGLKLEKHFWIVSRNGRPQKL